MGYIGSNNGPRKSEIVFRLGAKFFGIDECLFLEDVEDLLEEERQGTIDDIYQDGSGDFYLLFLVDFLPKMVYLRDLGISIDFQPQKVTRTNIDYKIASPFGQVANRNQSARCQTDGTVVCLS
jgi:hypothetical protein